METKTYILKQDYDACLKIASENQEGEFGIYCEKFIKLNKYLGIDKKPAKNLCVYRKEDNELVGVVQIYGIDREKKEVYLTATQSKMHWDDVIDNTTIPIYSKIIMGAGLELFKGCEHLDFIPDTIKATILTSYKEDDNLLELFKNTRLKYCREELVKPKPTFSVVELEGDRFLVLTYEKEKSIKNSGKYLL